MKTLPTLLASLTLATGFVSCTGPMPMGPAGAHIGLYAPPPSFGAAGFATPVTSVAGSLPARNGVQTFATPVTSVANSLPARNAMLNTTWSGQPGVARPAVSLRVNPTVLAVGGSDYQPHLAREYRNGWRAGANDAAYGASRDYRRAYACLGTGWESYFQEGYADGYEGRPMAH